MKLRTLSVLVDDRAGVLMQVSSLFARRGFNIHSLTVGNSERQGLSRMTIVVDVTTKSLEQATKQLNKLIHVIKVTELDAENSVERELALFKIRAEPAHRWQILELARMFQASVVDVAETSATVEFSGSTLELETLARMLEPLGVVELARSGCVALARG